MIRLTPIFMLLVVGSAHAQVDSAMISYLEGIDSIEQIDTVNAPYSHNIIELTDYSFKVNGEEKIIQQFQSDFMADTSMNGLKSLPLGKVTRIEGDSSISYQKLILIDSVLSFRVAGVGYERDDNHVDSIY